MFQNRITLHALEGVCRERKLLRIGSHINAGDREKILGAGCDGYIPKPVDPQSLPGEVARYLQQGRLKSA